MKFVVWPCLPEPRLTTTTTGQIWLAARGSNHPRSVPAILRADLEPEQGKETGLSRRKKRAVGGRRGGRRD